MNIPLQYDPSRLSKENGIGETKIRRNLKFL